MVPRCARESASSRRCSTRTRSSRAAWSMSASSTSPAAWPWASPGRCSARPGCRTTCARRPVLRLRDYDFDVITRTSRTPTVASDPHRRDVRVAQDRRAVHRPAAGVEGSQGSVMVADKKIAWPAARPRQRRARQQPRPHPRDHGHLDGVAHPPLQAGHRGLPGPAGQAYVAVEVGQGRPGCHLVSDGGTRPTARTSATSFNSLQAVAAMCEGGQMADVIVASPRSTP